MSVTGLLHGDTGQFICQVVGALICAAWAFGSTFIVFKVVNSIKSMRVSPEVELEGLDVPEFGGLAYPDDVVTAPDPGHGLTPHGLAPGTVHAAQAPAGWRLIHPNRNPNRNSDRLPFDKDYD